MYSSSRLFILVEKFNHTIGAPEQAKFLKRHCTYSHVPRFVMSTNHSTEITIFQRCYDEVAEAVEETGGAVNHETAEKLEYLEVEHLFI